MSMTSFFFVLFFKLPWRCPSLVKDCFHGIAPGYLVDYMSAFYRLDYSERPLYENLEKNAFLINWDFVTLSRPWSGCHQPGHLSR